MSIRSYLSITLVICSLSACAAQAPNIEAERAELLQLHELQRKAHVGKDAALLTSSFADTFYSISRGRVSTPTREASTARFRAYFDQSTFLEWDDIAPPTIRISPDGQMGYVIVQKRVRLTATDSAGVQTPEHTEFAWLETYEKLGGVWRLTALASTDRPGEPSR